MILYNEFKPFSKLVDSEFYNDFETFSKLVHENENGNENDVTTNKILGSLEILAIKNAASLLNRVYINNGVKNFPQRYCESMQVKGPQIYGPSNFEDDKIVSNLSPVHLVQIKQLPLVSQNFLLDQTRKTKANSQCFSSLIQEKILAHQRELFFVDQMYRALVDSRPLNLGFHLEHFWNPSGMLFYPLKVLFNGFPILFKILSENCEIL